MSSNESSGQHNLSAVIVIAVILLLGGGAYVYTTHLSPTRIGFVNFSDFQFAKVLDVADGTAIQLERIDFDGDEALKLTRYDVIYFFAHGINLSDHHMAAIDAASPHVA